MSSHSHTSRTIRYYRSQQRTLHGCHAARHDYYVLMVYQSGRAALWMNEELRCEAGDLMLIPAGMQHRMREATGDIAARGVGFYATPELTRAVSGSANYLTAFERIRGGGLPIARIPAERQQFFESILNEVAHESANDSTEAAVASEHLLSLLLIETARVFQPLHAGPAATPIADSPVARALRYIEEHGLRPISLDEVAEAVGRSPAHLTTAVRAATGRSVLAWIQNLRLTEARRRLLRTDESIENIAESVGYADARHFSRLFRRETGLAPGAWRKKSAPAG